jgi:hypothetical protein
LQAAGERVKVAAEELELLGIADKTANACPPIFPRICARGERDFGIGATPNASITDTIPDPERT